MTPTRRETACERDERIVRESQAHWYSDAYGVVAGMTIGDERLKAHAAGDLDGVVHGGVKFHADYATAKQAIDSLAKALAGEP